MSSLRTDPSLVVSQAMAMKHTILLPLLAIFLSNIHAYNGASAMMDSEEVELQKELQTLNKHPVKTIKSKEGDIIDCIDIDKQPALDHPLLKNHTVQTRPQSFPAGITEGSFSRATIELKSGREACPQGTVPIHRIQKEDLVRTRSIPNVVAFSRSPDDYKYTGPPRHGAVALMPLKNSGVYHGGAGRLSVHNVSVQQDQTSGAVVWAQNGPNDVNMINFVGAGWMVSPQVNGDSLTRLFVYWTTDSGAKVGCFNLLCPGFVQVDPVIGPKYVFSPVSSYGGPLHDFGILVYKDRETGNWWLAVSGGNFKLVKVGYWPREILTDLNTGANQMGWGGFTIAGKNRVSPPMGNGRKPDGDYFHACYFIDMTYVDPSGVAYPPQQANKISDTWNCYGLKNGSTSLGSRSVGYGMTFGGPGGLCDP